MPQPSTYVSMCFLGPHSMPCFGGLSNHQGHRQASCRAGSRGLPACLQQAGCRQAFVALTEGRTHDPSAARALQLPKGSIVVMDRSYNDYAWYNALNNNGISFVTRLKTNVRYRVIKRRTVPKSKGLTCFQTIEFTGAKAKTVLSGFVVLAIKTPIPAFITLYLINNLKGISKNCQFEQFGDCN